MCQKTAGWLPNSADPDQMLHSAASGSTLFAWPILSQYLGLLLFYFFMCLKKMLDDCQTSVDPDQMPHYTSTRAFLSKYLG